jgi:hypothetical protein
VGKPAQEVVIGNENVRLIMWERTMAGKHEVPKADTSTFYFVNVSVSEDDLPNIDVLFPTPDTTFTLFTAILDAGLKVGFALNAKADLVVCSLTDRREGSPTLGACLTGGGEGWYDALRVVLYKYTSLLQGDFANGSSPTGMKKRIM